MGGCSKDGDGAADYEAFVKLEREKAAAFAVGGEDCVAKSKSLGEWRAKNAAAYKALQTKLSARWPKGPPEELTTKHGEKVKEDNKAVIDAMLACKDNAELSNVMEELKRK